MVRDDRIVKSIVIPNFEFVMSMIEKNIFRPLPSINNLDDLEEAAVQEEGDPNWCYLEGIYSIFLHLICDPEIDVKMLKGFVTGKFVSRILELFDSEVHGERDCLKNILHKLYAKLVPRRKMIRSKMNECLTNLIHQEHKFNGAAEVLDIMSSIIAGFATPLRQEHVDFFNSTIV